MKFTYIDCYIIDEIGNFLNDHFYVQKENPNSNIDLEDITESKSITLNTLEECFKLVGRLLILNCNVLIILMILKLINTNLFYYLYLI